MALIEPLKSERKEFENCPHVCYHPPSLLFVSSGNPFSKHCLSIRRSETWLRPSPRGRDRNANSQQVPSPADQARTQETSRVVSPQRRQQVAIVALLQSFDVARLKFNAPLRFRQICLASVSQLLPSKTFSCRSNVILIELSFLDSSSIYVPRLQLPMSLRQIFEIFHSQTRIHYFLANLLFSFDIFTSSCLQKFRISKPRMLYAFFYPRCPGKS